MMKALLANHAPLIFQMFNRVLIESLVTLEDEVMILVTELITGLLDQYLNSNECYTYLS